MAVRKVKKKQLMATIGHTARSARNALGLTQEDAGERIGVSANFYALIERGHALPSVPTLYWMTVALQVDAHRLLGLRPNSARARARPHSGRKKATGSPEGYSPEVRRLVRRLRAASPATLRSVRRVLKEIEQAYER